MPFPLHFLSTSGLSSPLGGALLCAAALQVGCGVAETPADDAGADAIISDAVRDAADADTATDLLDTTSEDVAPELDTADALPNDATDDDVPDTVVDADLDTDRDTALDDTTTDVSVDPTVEVDNDTVDALDDPATDAGSDPDAYAAADVPDDADGSVPPPDCLVPSRQDPTGTHRWEDPLGVATVTIGDRDTCRRTYTLSTTATLRHGMPENPRVLVEQGGDPILRTGNDLFDALYALARTETRQLSVEAIRDGAFNNGSEVPCGGCFETGRLWNYVWTRDTAYAVDLGLAEVDPTRALASLLFKLSERRGGGDLQIVQDTGTGGSYPVSSDRVAWALGAAALLPHLPADQREAFRDTAYEALRNTLQHDRRVVYDPADGLYRGEQSFLDWREQTYPGWTATEVVHIANSKALGTNLLHLAALELARDLAIEVDDTPNVTLFSEWATALREDIQRVFWLPTEEMFSTYQTTTLDPSPVRRYDLLSSSLAVLMDVADSSQAQAVLANYPHYGPGAPVVWPQQQLTPVYHNRGEWPFVTAYWLRAAAHANNPTVADRMVRALVRGAAINLSNMENFEAGTGAAYFEDGIYSGPVVNSQRQLWSVAGYLSMVHHTLFGLRFEADALTLQPYVPATIRSALFGASNALVLQELRWLDHTLSVVLHLPDDAGEGALVVDAIHLDGVPIEGTSIPRTDLLPTSQIEVFLTAGTAPAPASITVASPANWQNIFGPRTPNLVSVAGVTDRVVLTFDPGGETPADVTFTIWRDGVAIATDVPGTTTIWEDPTVDANGERSPCYAVSTTFVASGNHSQHAPPRCWWGDAGQRVTSHFANQFEVVGGVGVTNHGRFHYEGWGDPGHRIVVPAFTATQTGEHLIQVSYGNGAGAINTGITCAVKRVRVFDTADETEVGAGVLVMPHLGDWSRWADSNLVPATLTAGRTYRIEIDNSDDAINMTAFAHFTAYTGGTGGASGPFNRVNIAEVKVLAR